MPKTAKKTRTISITLPIELDDWINKVIESTNKAGGKLTKSALISQVLELSIIEARMAYEESKDKTKESTEA